MKHMAETGLLVEIRHSRKATVSNFSFLAITLWRMRLLPVGHGLSDEATTFQCRDRLSFRQLLGVCIDEAIPEATTVENCRHE